MAKSAYTLWKVAFREQKCTTITVRMTICCEAYMLVVDQCHIAHTWCNWCILPLSNCHQQVTYPNRRLCQCQELKHVSLPKVMKRRLCNDIDSEHTRRPHMTVRQQAEDVTTRHSRYNDVIIEHIGTPHMTLSHPVESVTMTYSRFNDVKIECIRKSHTMVGQQAEHVRIVTGQRVTQKNDHSKRKIAWSTLFVELQWLPIRTWIMLTLLLSHDGNWQSISWSRRWSNKYSTSVR